MSSDPKRIIVTESRCNAGSVHTVLVYHQNFPEMHIEDVSPEAAAKHLVNRFEASRGVAPDSLHRDALRLAIDDVRAFLEYDEHIHHGHDAQGHNLSA